jgi:inner membrane protein
MFNLLGVGALILILLIPLAMIDGVLDDRLARRNEAVADITSSWGKEQSIIGPVLCLPYYFHGTVVRAVTLPDGRVESREVDVQTQTRYRGIYDAAVFRRQIKLTGQFAPPDIAALKIDPKDVIWKDATVTAAVTKA